jgi:Na+/proline symporter
MANLVFPMAYLVVAYVFLPLYFRHGVISIFELLAHRFGPRCGGWPWCSSSS